MASTSFPNILKHCVVAVYREGGISAKNQRDRFIQALKIARARLQEYGFLVLSGEAPTAPVSLTPKGRAREMKHKREGRAKSVLFDTLYEKFDVEGKRAAAEKKMQEKAAEKLLAERDAKKTKPKS